MTAPPSLRALLIDDESKARRVIRMLLEEHFPQITVCGEAENLPDGSMCIRQLRPDIVFLDVEMPHYAGTRLLEFLAPHETDFELIFTTAHSAFAITAFQLNAIDYLLKPTVDVRTSPSSFPACNSIWHRRSRASWPCRQRRASFTWTWRTSC
jgi:two-component system, LytTR family, response regulator